MTLRDNFITALERKMPQGRVPHFELALFHTMELFGKVHPEYRNYSQWNQMKPYEQKRIIIIKEEKEKCKIIYYN